MVGRGTMDVSGEFMFNATTKKKEKKNLILCERVFQLRFRLVLIKST